MTIKVVIKSLLSENGDDISTVRLMSLVSLATGVALGIYGVIAGKDLGGLAQVCCVFVGAAFTGKVAQKFAERE